MALLAFTITIALVTLIMITHGATKYGWTNLYFIPLAMVLVAVALGVVGYLA